METTATKTGLFLAAYQIGNLDMVGAPLFTVHLAVNTPQSTVSGTGSVTQAVNPPLDVHTSLFGNFTYMTVMPNNTHILVNATGTPVIHWPSHGGIGPVLPPNTQLQMVLESDWKSGTANFKYVDNLGQWQSVNNVPVKLITPNVLS